jgi:hypothetical protein
LITRIYRELRKLNSPKLPNEEMGKRTGQSFFKGRSTNGLKKKKKKCSTSLPIKKMQIKTLLRFHLTPVRMASMKSTNNRCQVCGGKVTLIHHWWECKLVQPLWKTEWRLLKKQKIELPYHLAIPFLGIYLRKCK